MDNRLKIRKNESRTRTAPPLVDSGAVPPLAADMTRARRDRILMLGLILFVFCGLVAYLLATLSSAHTARVRASYERNESTARLCAQLLDEQCDSAFSVLQALARRPSLEKNLDTEEHSAIAGALQDAVELVPDLLAVGVYRADGSLLEQYPRTAVLLRDATGEAWFRRLSNQRGPLPPYVNEVVRLPDPQRTEVFTVAIPIGSENPAPAGYLLAGFRLGDLYNWLRTVHVTGGSVLLVDPYGRVVARSASGTPASSQDRIPAEYPAFVRARRQEHGALLCPGGPLENIHGTGEVIVGYAAAARPGWIVLVVQPTEAEFALSQYLVRRLAIVGGPLLLALPIVGWALVFLYERQRRLAAALAERNDLLYRANRAKDDLLANVSHDLKTPIASMQLSVSGLLESERETGSPRRTAPAWDIQQVGECLRLVSQELDLLAARVRNLLDMSRLEAEAVPVWREPCDLTDIIAGALERLRPLIQNRPIAASFPPTPLLVECDPPQMETVILNLLENALKYSPPGSPLRLEGTAHEGEAHFALRDSGSGIPPGQEDRIFDKFYRSGTLHGAGGTGLGLAICKAIIETHGGRIQARNAPGGGAEFSFTLPLCDMSGESADPETEQRLWKELTA